MTKTYALPNPAAVCARIAADGGPQIDPSQPAGAVVTHGCTLAWTIAAGEITIAVTHKPFYITEAQIFAQLDTFFAGAK